MKSGSNLKRIILKISGELFKGEDSSLNIPFIEEFARELVEAKNLGIELAVLVGGGNFFRGEKLSKEFALPQLMLDYAGTLSTVINGIILMSIFEKMGQNSRVLNAYKIGEFIEQYEPKHAISYLEGGDIVILTGGLGIPFITTDTATALRGIELGVDIVLKGTKVEGVYDADPMENPDAKFYRKISYEEVLRNKLGIMDLTAVTLCMKKRIPIRVFNFKERGNLIKILKGKDIGTFIGGEDE